MDMFDIIFFRTGIIVLFVGSLMDTPKREIPENIKKVIIGLFCLVIANMFIHTFSPMTLATSMNVFMATLGFCIIYVYHDEKKDLKKFILGAAAINLLFYIGQKAGFDPVWDKVSFDQHGAFLGNTPRLMVYFALVTPLVPLYILPVAIALAMYSHQYTVFIPVVLILLFWQKSLKNRIGIGIVALLAIVILRDRLLASLLFRFNTAWKPILIAFFDQPLIGYGLGNRAIPELEVFGNSYLQFIIGVGIIGAAWYFYAINTLRKIIIFDKKSLALICLLVIMLIEYPVEITRLWYLIIAIIIMALIRDKTPIKIEGKNA